MLFVAGMLVPGVAFCAFAVKAQAMTVAVNIKQVWFRFFILNAFGLLC